MSRDPKTFIPFIPIWIERAKLSNRNYRVLLHLWSRMPGKVFPSQETIAECLDMNLKSVKGAIRELSEKEFIRIEKRKVAGVRFANEYFLKDDQGHPLTGPKNGPAQKTDPLTSPKNGPLNRPKKRAGNDTPMNEPPLNESPTSKETPFSSEKGEVDLDMGKNNRLSKDHQLEKLVRQKGKSYPTKKEFLEFLQSEGLEEIQDHRPNLWEMLESHKWHQWQKKDQQWSPIHSWQKYVKALEAKISY